MGHTRGARIAGKLLKFGLYILVTILVDGCGQDEDKKKALLTERLNMKLNESVHTVVDLGLRQVSAEQGGLCGLAAIYQALDSTILTKSQLRSMSYEDLVEVMAVEMGIPINDAGKKSDAEMLMHLHDCEFSHSFRWSSLFSQGFARIMNGKRCSTMTLPLASSQMQKM